eukprot:10635474-Lingulodinium_polyedra.AAC.1
MYEQVRTALAAWEELARYLPGKDSAEPSPLVGKQEFENKHAIRSEMQCSVRGPRKQRSSSS